MLRTAIRHSAIGTDQAKVGELQEIARRWSAARRIYARDYANIESLTAVLGSATTLSNQRARSGWAPVDLNYHYHKTACESAVAILKGGWENAFVRVRSLIGRNPRFGPSERHELFYLLKAPALLQAVLSGEVPEALTKKAEFAKNDHRMLCAYLRRMVLHRRPPKPRLTKTDGFELDNKIYSLFVSPRASKRRGKKARKRHFTGPWIAISGLEKNKTVKIPLAGTGLDFLDGATRRNLRVKVQPDGRIELQIPYDIEVSEHDQVERPEVIVGVDKGYRVLLAASADGDPAHSTLYGTDFGDLCDAIDETQQKRIKNRDRLRSHQKALRRIGDTASRRKARNIGRHNLGSQKQQGRLDAEQSTIKNAVGHGVNEFMDAHPNMTLLVEERLSGGGKNKGRKWNRRLSGWVKGTLAESLDNKTSAHGVRREEVNPAYTSQACHHCGFASRQNRKGQVFRCRNCGYDAHADGLAASNVRSRHGDFEITLWTPKARVKQILDARCRPVVKSATCGSNSTLPGVGRAVNTMDKFPTG